MWETVEPFAQCLNIHLSRSFVIKPLMPSQWSSLQTGHPKSKWKQHRASNNFPKTTNRHVHASFKESLMLEDMYTKHRQSGKTAYQLRQHNKFARMSVQILKILMKKKIHLLDLIGSFLVVFQSVARLATVGRN